MQELFEKLGNRGYLVVASNEIPGGFMSHNIYGGDAATPVAVVIERFGAFWMAYKPDANLMPDELAELTEADIRDLPGI